MARRREDTDYGRFAEALDFRLEGRLRQLHTAMPGIIREYDPATRRAVVQPALRVVLSDGSERRRAPLLDVPVVLPSGGGYSVHLPLAAGDVVLVVFAERSIAAVKRLFAEAAPAPEGIHALADAVVLPGWGPRGGGTAPAAGTAALQADDGSRRVAITGGAVEVEAPTIRLTGRVEIAGDVLVTGGGVWNEGINIGSGHTHLGVQPGVGFTGPPRPSP